MLNRVSFVFKRLTPVFRAAYHENVINRFENPKNVGSLDAKKKNVGTGLAGHPACGDIMKLQIEVGPDGKTIEKAVFKTYGCGSAIASSEYATELMHGMSIDDATNIRNGDIANYLKLPPVKLHCSLLAEDAIQKAIKNFKEKNPTE
jgi:Fe-S cluster assembly scaffold IscU